MLARLGTHRLRILFPALFLFLWISGCASTGESTPSDDSAEEVRALYLRGIEAFNEHDLDRFVEQFAEDIRMYTPTGWLQGTRSSWISHGGFIRRERVPRSTASGPGCMSGGTTGGWRSWSTRRSFEPIRS